MKRRVVVTGMGGVTALGQSWASIRRCLREGTTGVRHMPEWDRYHGLNTRLAAPVTGFDVEGRYDRKRLRTMGPVARMAVYATELALTDAGLLEDRCIRGGRAGIAYGSSFGSPKPVLGFAELMTQGASSKLTGTNYVQMMSHTAAVNIGLFFGMTGRIIPTSSACTSGSQGIGYAYEAIRFGLQDVMVAGGAEELCATEAAVFDTLYATSIRNDEPSMTPRPFDRDRDGLVIGEGAATLVLEEMQHAKARGAAIHAEVVGYGTNSDGNHITQPSAETMQVALRLALQDAELPPEAIGFVSAHGTATEWGDIAESQATVAVFGHRAPIHSLKSYFGHSLGACGGIEAWLGIEMMNEGWFAHTANLSNIDPRCAELDYVTTESRTSEIEYLMSNNFAFGGINTSLDFRRVAAQMTPQEGRGRMLSGISGAEVPPHVPESRFGVWFLGTKTWEGHVLAKALDDLARLVDNRTPACPVIVDVGCGWGRSFKMLADRFKAERLIGVDIDPHMLAASAAEAARQGLSVELYQAPISRLPLSDGSADLVFCHQTLHHLIDQHRAIREWRRVLKPDGLLLFAESTRAYIHSWIIRLLFRHPMHVQRSASEYLAMIRDAGFIVDPKSISYPYSWWSRPDLGIMERWLGVSPSAVREETLVNLVALRP